MYALSARELHDAERTLSRSRGGKKTEARAMGAAIDLLEVGGGLFAWGLVNGRYGVIAPIAGVALDGVLGLVLGAAAIFDLGGDKISPHIMNLSLASMGSFLMRKGVQVGSGMRTSAGLAPLGASDLGTSGGIFGGEFARGAISSGAARDLSDAELAAMTEAARARR